MPEQLYMVSINGEAIELTTDLKRAARVADTADLAFPGQVSTATVLL